MSTLNKSFLRKSPHLLTLTVVLTAFTTSSYSMQHGSDVTDCEKTMSYAVKDIDGTDYKNSCLNLNRGCTECKQQIKGYANSKMPTYAATVCGSTNNDCYIDLTNYCRFEDSDVTDAGLCRDNKPLPPTATHTSPRQ